MRNKGKHSENKLADFIPEVNVTHVIYEAMATQCLFGVIKQRGKYLGDPRNASCKCSQTLVSYRHRSSRTDAGRDIDATTLK